MISSINSNLSALVAFGKKMGVTSNNIANVNTDGFKKSRAVLNEGLNGEVKADIERIDTPGPIHTVIQDGVATEKEMSNVDLTEEIPEMLPTQRGYEANLKAIKTQDEMLGTLINLKT
jgi:flagellar basal-body rod protein FlgC